MQKLLCLMSVALLSIGANAFAASPEEEPTGPRVVRYRDLDLRTFEGVTALRHRVAKAAMSVCVRDSGERELIFQQLWAACVDGAMARAEPSVRAAIAQGGGAVRVVAR